MVMNHFPAIASLAKIDIDGGRRRWEAKTLFALGFPLQSATSNFVVVNMQPRLPKP
jgi:hypothetical protein